MKLTENNIKTFRQKHIISLQNIIPNNIAEKIRHEFDSSDFDLISQKRTGYYERVFGNQAKTCPGIRISLLHFDVDLYRPTLTALKKLWPLVVPGGIVVFDEYGIPPWEGESKAVDEFFKNQKIELKRFEWSSNPGAYLIK